MITIFTIRVAQINMELVEIGTLMKSNIYEQYDDARVLLHNFAAIKLPGKKLNSCRILKHNTKTTCISYL